MDTIESYACGELLGRGIAHRKQYGHHIEFEGDDFELPSFFYLASLNAYLHRTAPPNDVLHMSKRDDREIPVQMWCPVA